MKTLYFDCGMGAAGDMLMASLYEICPDKEKFLKTMNEMGLPGLSIEAEPSVKCGITGTHMKVTIHGEEEESVDVDLQGMSTSIIRSITMKIVSIAMLTITTMIMKIPTHDHSHRIPSSCPRNGRVSSRTDSSRMYI